MKNIMNLSPMFRLAGPGPRRKEPSHTLPESAVKFPSKPMEYDPAWKQDQNLPAGTVDSEVEIWC